jgi:maltose 6'-phosphate phosphatase
MEEHNGLWGWNSALAVHGPDVGPPEALRIASLNLHTWQEKNASLKLEQVAWSLAELDVHMVALQEVGEHLADNSRPNAGEFIARRMARHSGHAYHHVWRFAHIGFDVYREGLSLISRGPIHQVLEAELSIGPLRRVAMLAEVEWNGRRINLCNVHLSENANGGYEQATQLVQHILPRYTSAETPSILLADLNAQPHEGAVNLLREVGWHDAASLCIPPGDMSPTFFGEHPHRRIDYQFVKPGNAPGSALRPVSLHRLYARNAVANCYLPEVSDHAGLLGVYQLP